MYVYIPYIILYYVHSAYYYSIDMKKKISQLEHNIILCFSMIKMMFVDIY